MSTIGKLVRIELSKIFHSKLAYCVVAAILIFMTIINIQTKTAEIRNRATNLQFQQQAIQEFKDNVQHHEKRIEELTNKSDLTLMEKSELDRTKQELIQLKKEGEPIILTKVNLMESLTTLFISEFGVYFILPTVTLFVIGTNLAHEFSHKTIKLLLAQPIRRSHIFLSKWLACVIFIVFFLSIQAIAAVLEGGVFFGWGGLTDSAVSLTGVGIAAKGMSALHYVLQGLSYDVFGMTMVCTFAMALATFFPSPIVVFGITMITNFIGFALNDFLHSEYFSFLFPFSHLNYPYHFSFQAEYTISQSIVVLAIYLFAFLLIGMQKFRKMDMYL